MRSWLIVLTLLSTNLVPCDYVRAQDEPKKVTVEKGKKASDFIVTDDKGKPFKLSELMKKGDKNVVLIFSRANW